MEAWNGGQDDIVWVRSSSISLLHIALLNGQGRKLQNQKVEYFEELYPYNIFKL